MKHHELRRPLVLVFMAACLPALAQTLTERAQNDEITFVKDDDPAMNRAFEKARATLDDFFRLMKSPKAGTQGYAVKIAVSDGESTEYFWVNELKVNGDKISGVLNNEPEIVKKYKLGERFSFSRRQVVDWTYIEPAARRMHGNFTACALLTHEDPAEAEEFKQQYGLQCD